MAMTTDTTPFDLSDVSNCSRLEHTVTFCSNLTFVNITNLNSVSDFITPEEGTTAYKLYLAYKIWYFIIDVVLILPTIFGNSLIIVSLIRFKNLRKTKAFLLIGNLGISDLLVGLVLIPMDLVILLKPGFAQDPVACVWYLCIIFTLMTASVLNLFLLSLERCHAITRPFQHNIVFTAKRIYYAASIIWVIVILTGFTPVFLLSIGDLNFKLFQTCRDVLLFDTPYLLAMNSVVITALTISFVFFVVVIRIAIRKSAQKPLELGNTCTINNNNSGRHSRHNIRRDIRHTRLMVIVSGTFIICWAPYCIISLIPNQSVEVVFMRYWFGSLGLINSCLNWIVYGARNKRFRAAFRSILDCSCRKRGEIKITSNST